MEESKEVLSGALKEGIEAKCVTFSTQSFTGSRIFIMVASHLLENVTAACKTSKLPIPLNFEEVKVKSKKSSASLVSLDNEVHTSFWKMGIH